MRSSTKPGPYGWAVRRVLHSPLRLQTRPGLLIAAAPVSGAQLFRFPAAAFAPDRNRDNRTRLRAVVNCRVFFPAGIHEDSTAIFGRQKVRLTQRRSLGMGLVSKSLTLPAARTVSRRFTFTASRVYAIVHTVILRRSAANVLCLAICV